MARKKRWIISIIIVLAWVSLRCSAFAIHHEDKRFSLQGLKEVLIFVHTFYQGRESKPTWLDECRLRMDIGTKLKMAGIKVLTCSEWLTTPRKAILWVDIRITHDEQYMCEAKIKLDQNVYLKREPAVGTFFITTWSTHVSTSGGSPINEKRFRVFVGNIADAFIRDYRLANSGEKDWELYVFLCLGDVNTLIEKSNHKDPYIRGIAVASLGRMKDSRAVEPLITRLKDEHVGVRRWTAMALGDLEDSSSVEALIAALKDKDYEVRLWTVTALARIEDYHAVEPLIDVLERDKGHIIGQAARALKKITGQNFGSNAEEWRNWWRENKQKFSRGR